MTVEQRLCRLERENQRLKIVLGILAVVPLVAIGMGVTQNGVVPRLAAERLELIDSRGNIVMLLSGEDPGTQGPSVAFFDSNRRMRMAMGVANSQGSTPYVQFDDAQGRRVLNIATGNQPKPGIMRLRPNGQVDGIAP